MKTLAEKVAEFRKEKGWNPTQMAREVGTTRQNIQHLEQSGSDFIPHYIADLARVMGTPVAVLLGSDDAAVARMTPRNVGTAKITRAAAMSPETERKLTRFLAVLYQLDDERRGYALAEAIETLLDHLPLPPTA